MHEGTKKRGTEGRIKNKLGASVVSLGGKRAALKGGKRERRQIYLRTLLKRVVRRLIQRERDAKKRRS